MWMLKKNEQNEKRENKYIRRGKKMRRTENEKNYSKKKKRWKICTGFRFFGFLFVGKWHIVCTLFTW